MAFSDSFDAIKGYAANAAQVAAKKTKMLAVIAKANVAILAEEDKVKKAQMELGKVYYKNFILDEEPDQAEFLPWCDKITESLKLIDNLKLEIELARKENESASAKEVPEDVNEEPEAVDEEPELTTEEPELPEIVVVEEVPAAEEADPEEEAAPTEEIAPQDAPTEE